MCPKNGGQYTKKWGAVHGWGIHGVYVGYSWDIRMYRVCVGYVSGMYRECIETSEVRKMIIENNNINNNEQQY